MIVPSVNNVLILHSPRDVPAQSHGAQSTLLHPLHQFRILSTGAGAVAVAKTGDEDFVNGVVEQLMMGAMSAGQPVGQSRVIPSLLTAAISNDGNILVTRNVFVNCCSGICMELLLWCCCHMAVSFAQRPTGLDCAVLCYAALCFG